MKNIRINKYIRLKLLEIGESGESMDHVLSRLLDEIGVAPDKDKNKKTFGMRMSDETYAKLKSKQGKGESLIAVIERAIENREESFKE